MNARLQEVGGAAATALPVEVMARPTLEVMRPTTAVLIQRAKTFHAGIGTHLRSAAGYTLLFGQAMLTLKASVPHGEFQALRKAEMPEIPERTARYYMTLTERLKTKTATIAVLLEQPELLTSPELAEEQREKLDKAVFTEFDGKTITEIAREERVIRGPKKVSEVNHHPGKKLSLAEKHAQEVALAKSDWQSIQTQLGGYAARFLLLEDIEVNAQIAALETALAARRQWVDAPKGSRDAKRIEKLFSREGAKGAKGK